MKKNKIVISPDFLDSLSKDEQIDDISLKFNISDDFKSVNIDLTSFTNSTLQRRKDLKQFKDFLINCRQSISTKKAFYQLFTNFMRNVRDDFNSTKDLEKTIKDYASFLLNKVNNKEVSPSSYRAYRWQLRIIFNECYGLNNLDFDKAYPEYAKRTGSIKNPTILDNKGQEKCLSKKDFKEITKVFISLTYFIDGLMKDNENKKQTFIHKNVYKLDFNLNYQALRQLQNKRTFLLMLAFISLTGANLNPLIRMKRSDLIIDKEREVISFKITCNRKNKEQNHNFPMKEKQLDFFEKLISYSLDLCPNDDILFPYIGNSLTDMKPTYYGIEDFISQYALINKGFIGDYEGFTITARKLRNSYANQFDDIDTRSVALFNKPSTAAKHYADGNSDDNNQQLQNAMNIYTIALSNSENIQDIRDNIEKINVIDITDIQSLKKENSQITTSGFFCLNSKEGVEPEKYARKLEKIKLTEISEVHCANILACFNCKNSLLVNNFENIYLLKSFYDYLNEIIYETDTSSLFSDKNAVKDALSAIKIILETKIDKQLIKQVNKHIEIYKIHPIWNVEG